MLQVQAMYNWPNVAERTAAVYNTVLSTASNHDELLPRLRRYRSIGAWAGLVFCCIVVLLHWFWLFLEWQQPVAEVEAAVNWPSIQQMLGEDAVQQQQKRVEQAGTNGEHDSKQQQQQREQQQHQKLRAAPSQRQQEVPAASIHGIAAAEQPNQRYHLRPRTTQQ